MTDIQANLWAKFNLTPRQREVANLICEGFNNRQMAEQLFVTEKAIKFHVTNILKLTKVDRTKELIALIDKLCKKG